jgi:hypothetical protein
MVATAPNLALTGEDVNATEDVAPPIAAPLVVVVYLTSVSILNIGRYMAMMITPTIIPTAIIIRGSMIDVSDWIAESTSSS